MGKNNVKRPQRPKSDRATHDILSAYGSFTSTNRVKVSKPSRQGYGTPEQRVANAVTVRKMTDEEIKAMRAKAPTARRESLYGFRKGALFA